MSESIFDLSFDEMPTILPVLPFADMFLFPQTKLQLRLSETRYVNLVLNALSHGRILGVVQPAAHENQAEKLYRTGCAGRVSGFSETQDDCLAVTLTGVARFDCVREIQDFKGYRRIETDFSRFKDDFNPPVFKRDLSALFKALDLYAYSNKIDVDSSVFKKTAPAETLSAIVQNLPFQAAEKQAFLESVSLDERYDTLLFMLNSSATDAGVKKAGFC